MQHWKVVYESELVDSFLHDKYGIWIHLNVAYDFKKKFQLKNIQFNTHLAINIGNVSYNVGIEDLREKREEVGKQIREEEVEKAKVQQDLQVLTKRLAHINDSLARKVSEYGMVQTS